MYRSNVLVCGGTGCTSSNSLTIVHKQAECLDEEVEPLEGLINASGTEDDDAIVGRNAQLSASLLLVLGMEKSSRYDIGNHLDGMLADESTTECSLPHPLTDSYEREWCSVVGLKLTLKNAPREIARVRSYQLRTGVTVFRI